MRHEPTRAVLFCLIGLILAAVILLNGCSQPLTWRYTKDEINRHTLHPCEDLTPAAKDSMNDYIEQWWITRENWDCGTVTQEQIDSIETILMQFTEI